MWGEKNMNLNEDKIDSMIDTYRNYYETLKDEIALYPFYDQPLISTCPNTLLAQVSKWRLIPKLTIKIPSQKRHQWTCFGFLKKIQPPGTHFQLIFHFILAMVSIVSLGSADREGLRSSDGVEGGSTLCVVTQSIWVTCLACYRKWKIHRLLRLFLRFFWSL